MPGCRPNFKIKLLGRKKLLSPIMDYSKAFDLKSYIEPIRAGDPAMLSYIGPETRDQLKPKTKMLFSAYG